MWNKHDFNWFHHVIHNNLIVSAGNLIDVAAHIDDNLSLKRIMMQLSSDMYLSYWLIFHRAQYDVTVKGGCQTNRLLLDFFLTFPEMVIVNYN